MKNPFNKIKDFFIGDKDDDNKTGRTAKSAGQKSAKAQSGGGGSMDVSNLYQKWSNLYSDSGSGNNQAVLLLQKQIESYEKQIELRRQRLLNEMKPTVFAVTGAKKSAAPALKDTDDTLPYQPILLDINKVLTDLRAKRAAQLAAKSGQQVDMAPLTSVRKPSAGKQATKSLSVKRSSQQNASVSKPRGEQSKMAASASPSSKPESTAVGAEVAEPSAPDVQSKEDASGGSTSSTSDNSEQLHGLNAILMDMIVEAEKPSAPKPKESEKKLSGEDLAAMSKNEPGRFDVLVNDHVKHSLFGTQPTPEESSNWDSKQARVVKQRFEQLSWNPKQPLEIRTFCSSCKPRYPQPS